jgi:hypothetical protein
VAGAGVPAAVKQRDTREARVAQGLDEHCLRQRTAYSTEPVVERCHFAVRE